jgi:hypothetical protein
VIDKYKRLIIALDADIYFRNILIQNDLSVQFCLVTIYDNMLYAVLHNLNAGVKRATP